MEKMKLNSPYDSIARTCANDKCTKKPSTSPVPWASVAFKALPDGIFNVMMMVGFKSVLKSMVEI
jgi:hypothetical protein